MPDACSSVPHPATHPPRECLSPPARIIPIELAPDYSDGLVAAALPPFTITGPASTLPLGSPPTNPATPGTDPRLQIQQSLFFDPPTNSIPNPPTEWFWNIRQGEKLRFADAGRYFIIAGPMTTLNPERFVNLDTPGNLFVSLPPGITPPAGTTSGAEGLFLVNGQDDDGDGYVDNSFDGIDNDGDGLTDPGFDGIDNDGVNGVVDDQNEVFLRIIGGTLMYDPRPFATAAFNSPPGYNPEFEGETAPSLPALNFTNAAGFINKPYTILRRPVTTRGARETVLPQGTVIDLTTFNTTQERSRLPVDPISKYVDILIAPNGTIFRADAASGNAPIIPFYHFWIAEREDVFGPVAQVGVPYLLPMPARSFGYPNAGDASGRVLKGDRRLVSMFTRTGQILTNTIEQFDGSGNPAGSPPTPPSDFGVNLPFLAAQQGVRVAP